MSNWSPHIEIKKIGADFGFTFEEPERTLNKTHRRELDNFSTPPPASGKRKKRDRRSEETSHLDRAQQKQNQSRSQSYQPRRKEKRQRPATSRGMNTLADKIPRKSNIRQEQEEKPSPCGRRDLSNPIHILSIKSAPRTISNGIRERHERKKSLVVDLSSGEEREQNFNSDGAVKSTPQKSRNGQIRIRSSIENDDTSNCPWTDGRPSTPPTPHPPSETPPTTQNKVIDLEDEEFHCRPASKAEIALNTASLMKPPKGKRTRIDPTRKNGGKENKNERMRETTTGSPDSSHGLQFRRAKSPQKSSNEKPSICNSLDSPSTPLNSKQPTTKNAQAKHPKKSPTTPITLVWAKTRNQPDPAEKKAARKAHRHRPKRTAGKKSLFLVVNSVAQNCLTNSPRKIDCSWRINYGK